MCMQEHQNGGSEKCKVNGSVRQLAEVVENIWQYFLYLRRKILKIWQDHSSKFQDPTILETKNI